MDKFKMKMILTAIDLWDIMDESKEPSPSNADLRAKEEHQRWVKKTMFIFGLNLIDNELAHIKSCEGVIKA